MKLQLARTKHKERRLVSSDLSTHCVESTEQKNSTATNSTTSSPRGYEDTQEEFNLEFWAQIGELNECIYLVAEIVRRTEFHSIKFCLKHELSSEDLRRIKPVFRAALVYMQDHSSSAKPLRLFLAQHWRAFRSSMSYLLPGCYAWPKPAYPFLGPFYHITWHWCFSKIPLDKQTCWVSKADITWMYFLWVSSLSTWATCLEKIFSRPVRAWMPTMVTPMGQGAFPMAICR